MKKILRILFVGVLGAVFLQSCSALRNPLKIKNYVELETTEGSLVVGLYEGTPAHRDNFIGKCSSNFYDGTLMYSAVRNTEYSFGLRRGSREKDLLSADLNGGRTLPAEFNEKILPLRYTIAMKSVDGAENPEKSSDACLFFIIDGGKKLDIHEIRTTIAIKNRDTYKLYIEEYLSRPENAALKDSMKALQTMQTMKQYNERYAELMNIVRPQIDKDGIELFSISEKNIERYLKDGGVPMYEGRYTVFGEISVGEDVVGRLSGIGTNLDGVPKKEVSIVSTNVLKKKDFKKKYK